MPEPDWFFPDQEYLLAGCGRPTVADDRQSDSPDFTLQVARRQNVDDIEDLLTLIEFHESPRR